MVRVVLKKLACRLFPKLFIPASKKISGIEFEVDNWITSVIIVNKIIPVVGIRPFPLDELSLMVATVAWQRPTHIFEWGTNIGKSARIFFETVSALKLGTEIHSTDLPDDIEHVEHPGVRRGKMVKGRKNVYLHQGDGLDTSLKIYNGIPAGSCSALFFLDGDHSYHSVFRELRGIAEVSAKSCILVHDSFFQSQESGYNTGPFLAIQQFLGDYPEYRAISTKLGLPGMTLLYRQNKLW